MISSKKNEPTSKQLWKWAKMTDNNEHLKVRIDLARFFNDNAREDYFLHDAVEEGEARYYRNMQVYCDVTRGLLNNIREVYGEEVYNKVRRCL